MTTRMVRVGVSGAAATGIDVAALIFLVEAMGSHVTLAAFLGATLGGVSNFLINKYWAFRDGSRIDLRQVTVYTFVSVVTAAFVAVAVHLLAVVMGVPYLLAKAIAAALVFVVWTYPAQARLVFTADPEQTAPRRRVPVRRLDTTSRLPIHSRPGSEAARRRQHKRSPSESSDKPSSVPASVALGRRRPFF